MDRTNQLPRVTRVALQLQGSGIEISGVVKTNLRKPPVPVTFSCAKGLMVEREPGVQKPADGRIKRWVVDVLRTEHEHFKAAVETATVPYRRAGLTTQRDGFAKALSILEPAFG